MPSGDPVITTANRSADTSPAPKPIPMSISAVPPRLRGVRSGSVQTARLSDAGRERPASMLMEGRPVLRAARAMPALVDDVGQQAEEAGALDRLGELALLLGRHGRDPGRHDLAALRDVAREQLHVLVVDLRSVRAGERAGLAPTEEWATRSATTAACTCTCCAECHVRLQIGRAHV